MEFFFSLNRQWPKYVILSTFATLITTVSLKFLIEHKIYKNIEIEMLFGNLRLIAIMLMITGIVILLSKYNYCKKQQTITLKNSFLLGCIQGLCIPLRGLSRSGITISSAIIFGVSNKEAEIFSFALSIVLTPIVIIHEALRIAKNHDYISNYLLPTYSFTQINIFLLTGLIASFISGLIALKLLSTWLNKGRWHLFGLYCIPLSLLILLLDRYII